MKRLDRRKVVQLTDDMDDQAAKTDEMLCGGPIPQDEIEALRQVTASHRAAALAAIPVQVHRVALAAEPPAGLGRA